MVTVNFNTKKLDYLAMLGARTLKQMVWSSPVDDTEGKGQVTVTSKTKQAYNSAMLGARTVKHSEIFLMTRR